MSGMHYPRIAINVLCLALLAGCAPTSEKSAQASGPAPNFTLASLDGQNTSLSSLRGKVVVLDFWATWCPPCRRSLPHLQKLSEDPELKSKGLVVLAINQREGLSEVQPFIAQTRYTFNVLRDTDGAVARAYNVEALPTTIIIGRDGNVRNVFVGFADDSVKQVDDAVNAALQ